jgi:hypothetical protein
MSRLGGPRRGPPSRDILGLPGLRMNLFRTTLCLLISCVSLWPPRRHRNLCAPCASSRAFLTTTAVSPRLTQMNEPGPAKPPTDRSGPPAVQPLFVFCNPWHPCHPW